jgi:hypothetical protein
MIILLFLITIDPRYHTFAEVAHELDSIAIHHPSIAMLDTIGFSTCDSLPLFAIKLSDNVEMNEDELEVLFIACHHAEEILGVELCMYMIHELTSNYGSDSSMTYWLDNRELWFIPLLNPDGHNIVMQGIDTTWRKNKRDNNNNDTFDLDYDGVDLNRNYDFYWSLGGSANPADEYYRSPASFSEKEIKAIRDFCADHHFVFCNTYHSARTGLGEVIYFPWRAGSYRSADYEFILNVADSMSKLIVNDQGNGHYVVLPGIGVDGRARNWLYGVCGTFSYCVEISTTTIQPGSMVDDICQRNSVGAYFLIDRADGSGITGHIYDTETGEPLSAEVVINGYYDHRVPPRSSDPLYGRFTRIVKPGSYDIEVYKDGFTPYYLNDVIVTNNTLTDITIYMDRLERDSYIQYNDPLIAVYPNPAHNVILIKLQNPSLFNTLKVCDISGRIVKTFPQPITSDVVWQCVDENNRKVTNGTYYIIGELTQVPHEMKAPASKKLVRKITITN